MAREKQKSPQSNGRGRLSRLRGAVARTAHKLTSKLHRGSVEPMEMQPPAPPRARAEGGQGRPRRPQTDVPLDLIGRAYTPAQTSLKGPFRATGEDLQRDQELAEGYAEERWNAEDRFTNKSGDARIGTHGRSYEPGEERSGRNR
jgi:hypothetical protein